MKDPEVLDAALALLPARNRKLVERHLREAAEYLNLELGRSSVRRKSLTDRLDLIAQHVQALEWLLSEHVSDLGTIGILCLDVPSLEPLEEFGTRGREAINRLADGSDSDRGGASLEVRLLGTVKRRFVRSHSFIYSFQRL
jgi:hypothetical protein